MQVSQNISLKHLNTFGIPAAAKYFSECFSIEDFQKMLADKKTAPLPKLILGGGSNILFTNNFDGLVLKNSIKGMEVVKNQQDLDNLNKKKSLAIDQQNADRLASDNSNLNKDEQAFQKDLNSGISKLAENAGNWRQVYDTLAGIYGRTNPELIKRLTPAEITAAGGDPITDQTYLDILLNKKKYNPSYNPQ